MILDYGNKSIVPASGSHLMTFLGTCPKSNSSRSLRSSTLIAKGRISSVSAEWKLHGDEATRDHSCPASRPSCVTGCRLSTGLKYQRRARCQGGSRLEGREIFGLSRHAAALMMTMMFLEVDFQGL